jgi:septum formation protein
MMTRLLTLASTSPRRIAFIKQIGIPFEVQSPSTDETPQPHETPRHLVTRLAREKAQSIRATVLTHRPSGLILAADTIVVSPKENRMGSKILGKPKTPQEAFQMLSQLAGKTHSVLTGYSLYEVNRNQKKEHQITRVIQSWVTLRTLTPTAIRHYIASGEVMDKAGAYAAQGLGMALIEKIQGSYSNIVGLPLSQVLTDLEEHFDCPVFSWKSGR